MIRLFLGNTLFFAALLGTVSCCSADAETATDRCAQLSQLLSKADFGTFALESTCAERQGKAFGTVSDTSADETVRYLSSRFGEPTTTEHPLADVPPAATNEEWREFFWKSTSYKNCSFALYDYTTPSLERVMFRIDCT